MADLSPEAIAIFDRVAATRKAIVMVARLARSCRKRIAEIDPAIGELVAADLLTRWTIPKGSDSFRRHGRAVSLSPYAAAAAGLRLNSRANHWMPAAGWKERPVRLRLGTMGPEIVILNEADMAIDPPGRLARVPDHREDSDPLARLIAAEASIGLPRPTYLHGMGIAWDTEMMTPGPMAPKIARRPRPTVCPGCDGVAMRNTETVKEYCPVCDAYCGDRRRDEIGAFERAERARIADAGREAG